jgi:two-component system, NtrC family, response regulator
MSKGNVLIIDDEHELRNLLAKILLLEDFTIFEAANGTEGDKLFMQEDLDVVITDVRLPDISGIELISKFKNYDPTVEIIVLTAYGTIEDGVKAIKEGAFDYITKGDEDNKIIPLTEKALQNAKMKKRIQQLEKRVSQKFLFDNIIGNSKEIKDAIEISKKVSLTDSPVLVLGETGTGKELFAQAIHNSSTRRNHPFVAINSSAFAKELLESEMFGYKAGAFTGANKNKKGLFEEANEGTIFLDEIADMDIALQAKLLRVIEEKSFIKQGDTKQTHVDVRIIAATNKNLEEEIKKGSFRSDLFYRINVVKIEIPSLRNRREDVELLANYFVKVYAEKLKRNISEIDKEYLNILKTYDFPGNIRELRNIIERSIILSEGNILRASSLPKDFSSYPGSTDKMDSSKLEDIEKHHILKILQETNGNKTKTAEILGIGLTTLYRKLQAYGIE